MTDTAKPAQYPGGEPSPTARVSAWRNHDFIRLWCAQATGLIGQQFSVLAMPLVAILTLHASASTVALLHTAFNLPGVVIALFVGVIVDRFRRRRVLIASDIGRAALMASIPVCAFTGLLSIQQLFILGLLIGVLDVTWLTAFRSYVPAVVPREHLSHAYALIGASDGVTRTAAPSLAGGAIALFGPPVGIAVTSVSYLCSAVSNSTIRRREPRRARHEQEPVVQAFRDGLIYAWRQHVVRAFAASEATYIFFWASMQSVLLVFLARDLGLSAAAIGLIFTIGTVGGLLGAATARRIGRRLKPGPAILVGNVTRSAGLALTPVAVLLGPIAIPALVAAQLINSFGWTLWDVHRETVTQQLLSDRFRGRANGSNQFLGSCALTFGSAAGAGVVALIGIVPTLVVGGAGGLLASGWLLAVKVWTIQQSPTSPDEGSTVVPA